MALLKGHASASAPAQAARAGKPTRAPSCRVNSRHDQVAKDSAIVLECQSTSSSSVGVGRREALRSVLLTGIATGMVAFLAPPPLPSSAKVSIASVMKGEDGERDIQMTASGIRTSLVSPGRGEAPRSGGLVVAHVVGSLEDGTVFLDTRAVGAPLAFPLGTTNAYVTEGLSQVVETMRGGEVRLAVVPSALGYGARGARLQLPPSRQEQGGEGGGASKGGRAGTVSIPGNAKLYYQVTLLRCQSLEGGLACCTDDTYPCIREEATGQQQGQQGQG